MSSKDNSQEENLKNVQAVSFAQSPLSDDTLKIRRNFMVFGVLCVLASIDGVQINSLFGINISSIQSVYSLRELVVSVLGVLLVYLGVHYALVLYLDYSKWDFRADISAIEKCFNDTRIAYNSINQIRNIQDSCETRYQQSVDNLNAARDKLKSPNFEPYLKDVAEKIDKALDSTQVIKSQIDSETQHLETVLDLNDKAKLFTDKRKKQIHLEKWKIATFDITIPYCLAAFSLYNGWCEISFVLF